MSQEETHKKSLTIQRLLPELIKVKNDIEYIEGIQFLIQDTYLNIDDSEESILNIFDTQYGNPIQLQLIDLMRKAKYDHDPGAKPLQQDYLPEKPEEEPAKPRIEYNQGPPLIDEVIFDGHNEQYPQATVRDLFNSLGGVAEAPVADIIPDAIDVPEHDKDAVPLDLPAPEQAFENLQVCELQAAFKQNIKQIGQELYDKLEGLRKALCVEQDRIAQAVADLEKAILNLHHRHARQIVQIYIESKRLQRLVFEKDDTVLHLDGLIHDCTNLQEKLKNCENNKGLDLHYIQDLKQQKELNLGILKELEKLGEYADKNINAPPLIPIEQIPTASAQAIKNEIEEAQNEMHQIAEAENEVKKEQEKVQQEQEQKKAEEQLQQANKEEEKPAQPAAEKPEEKPAEPAVEQKKPEEVGVDAPIVKPEEEKPAEPGAEEKPAEPGAEEKPAEPGAENKPAEPGAEEKPAEPGAEKPAEEKPVEEKPAEEKKEEEKPAEEKKEEEKPAEEKKEEEKPAEEKKEEEKPAEEKKAEEKPAEEKKEEEKPVEEKKEEEKPAEEKKEEEKPAEEKKEEEKPVEEKPAEEKKEEEKPVEEKPAEEKKAEGLLVRLRPNKNKKK